MFHVKEVSDFHLKNGERCVDIRKSFFAPLFHVEKYVIDVQQNRKTE
jgi:hypothetical protein